MQHNDIARLRRKAAVNRGLRRAMAEAELAERLVPIDNKEALSIAHATVQRLGAMMKKAAARNARPKPYHEVQARALRALAYALKTVKRYAEAEDLLRESIRLYESLNDGLHLVGCMELLHLIYRDQGRYTEALEALDRALALESQVGEQWQEAAIHSARGILLMLLGRPDEAGRAYARGLRLARKNDDIRGQILILGDLGLFFNSRNEGDKAYAAFTEAIALHRRHRLLGNLNYMTILWNYARLLINRGQLREASAIIQQGIAAAERAGLQRDRAMLLIDHARLLISLADYGPALEDLQQASGICESLAFVSCEALAQALMAELYTTLAYPKAAVEAARRSTRLLAACDTDKSVDILEIFRIIYVLTRGGNTDFDIDHFSALFSSEKEARLKQDNLHKLPGILLAYGLLREIQGDRAAARRELEEGLALCEHFKLRHTQSETLYHLGRLNAADGANAAATSHFQQALELSRQAGSLDLMRRIHREMAVVCEALGRFREALQHSKLLRGLERKTRNSEFVDAARQLRKNAEYRRLQREQAADREELAALRQQHASLQRSLQAKTIHLDHISDYLSRLGAQLKKEDDESDAAFRRRIALFSDEIDRQLAETDWTQFEQEAADQDESFLLRLARRFPALTNTERKVCSLLRLNNTREEVSRLLSVSPRAVQSYRYRIRKKLALPADVNLNAYLLEL